MSMPVRHLPVLQSWDCHSCGNCCREFDVVVTEAERVRILAHGWQHDPDIGGTPLFVRGGPWWARSWRLNHRGDKGCVFLTPDNLCKLHQRFGQNAKPLACRLYPFLLVPAGDHWRVGIRYACPSAAANRGRPFAEHAAALAQLAAEYEKDQNGDMKNLPRPRLRRGQEIDWPDVQRFVKALAGILGDGSQTVERRWRKCLELARLCRQARFDSVRGKRLDEFLDLLARAVEADTPAAPEDVPAPGWVGRVLFRQMAAMYGRQDRGELRGTAQRSRLSLLAANCRFGIGRGAVPKINARIADRTFAELETPRGPISPAQAAMLERYYLTKLNSLQFFGPPNFRLDFWDGLDSLALTLPLALWLTRASDLPTGEQALAAALRIVDDHFGYNPVLRARRYKLAGRILAAQGELPRLIAWYSR